MTRQVLIGGKSKYLINGRNSPAGQVANLFHSVQLNVNNPHFLIMQGELEGIGPSTKISFTYNNRGQNTLISMQAASQKCSI